jgi:hypothetical protein
MTWQHQKWRHSSLVYFNSLTCPFNHSAFDKVGDEIEPDINSEAIEATIILMTKKHNHNILQFTLTNRTDYFECKDSERFKVEAESRRDKKLQNEQNPEKEPEPGNSEIIFVPELLSALQEAIKVCCVLLHFVLSVVVCCVVLCVVLHRSVVCRGELHCDHDRCFEISGDCELCGVVWYGVVWCVLLLKGGQS